VLLVQAVKLVESEILGIQDLLELLVYQALTVAREVKASRDLLACGASVVIPGWKDGLGRLDRPDGMAQLGWLVFLE